MSHINPKFRLMIYQPKTDDPLELVDGIKSITSTRTISGEGSIQLDFSDTGKLRLRIPSGGYVTSTVRDIFTLHTIIALHVKKNEKDAWRQLNLGYVDTVSHKAGAGGSHGYSFTFPTLDKKFREAELFIDYQKVSDKDKNKKNPTVQQQTIEAAITNVADTFKSMKTIPTIIQAVWDNLICDLMQVKLVQDPNPNISGRVNFGGKYFLAQTQEPDEAGLLSAEIMLSGLTTNITQIFELTSCFAFGQSVNFWQVLFSVLSEPFYEMFIDPLETVEGEEGFLEGQTYYIIKQGQSKFVFRKTPFDEYFLNGSWSLTKPKTFHTIQPEDIKDFSIIYDSKEIYSGVHVGLGILDIANILIAPVKWNNLIRGISGNPRVLQVKLAGLGFDKDSAPEARAGIIEVLEALRDQLYEIFFQPDDLKIGRGSMMTSFDFYRVGKPFEVDQIKINEVELPTLGYITGVTDTFDAAGQAASNVQFKWVPYNMVQN